MLRSRPTRSTTSGVFGSRAAIGGSVPSFTCAAKNGGSWKDRSSAAAGPSRKAIQAVTRRTRVPRMSGDLLEAGFLGRDLADADEMGRGDLDHGRARPIRADRIRLRPLRRV